MNLVTTQYIDRNERNNYLEVHTDGQVVNLTICHWTSFEEIDLTRDQVKSLMDELAKWLEAKEIEGLDPMSLEKWQRLRNRRREVR